MLVIAPGLPQPCKRSAPVVRFRQPVAGRTRDFLMVGQVSDPSNARRSSRVSEVGLPGFAGGQQVARGGQGTAAS